MDPRVALQTQTALRPRADRGAFGLMVMSHFATRRFFALPSLPHFSRSVIPFPSHFDMKNTSETSPLTRQVIIILFFYSSNSARVSLAVCRKVQISHLSSSLLLNFHPIFRSLSLLEPLVVNLQRRQGILQVHLVFYDLIGPGCTFRGVRP